jgi:hypothetical protein
VRHVTVRGAQGYRDETRRDHRAVQTHADGFRWVNGVRRRECDSSRVHARWSTPVTATGARLPGATAVAKVDGGRAREPGEDAVPDGKDTFAGGDRRYVRGMGTRRSAAPLREPPDGSSSVKAVHAGKLSGRTSVHTGRVRERPLGVPTLSTGGSAEVTGTPHPSGTGSWFCLFPKMGAPTVTQPGASPSLDRLAPGPTNPTGGSGATGPSCVRPSLCTEQGGYILAAPRGPGRLV